MICRECGAPVRARGLCSVHYMRVWRTGMTTRRKAANGAGHLTKHGYREVTVGGRKTLQHRVVMEDRLGRALFPEESVHHINGVRDDNRPENLELWSSSQPAGQRVADKIAWAKHILAAYEED